MGSSTFFPSGFLAIAVFATGADAATLSGTVTGPDGAPFRAAFVQARNAQMKMTVNVLSDARGHYRADNLPAGDYRLQVRAVGYKADPREGVKLAAGESAAYDFALQKGVVRWSDISVQQGLELLPDARGKRELFTYCTGCHGFESRMAAVKRDEDGWRSRVAYMREVVSYAFTPQRGFDDQKAEDIVYYLNHVFGEDSTALPRSPTDVPHYPNTVRPISEEALKIVYVIYDMPGPARMSWSALPDRDGKVWIAEYGPANKIAHLDPKTGEIAEYPVPNPRSASIHSVVPAPDGTVWLTEQGAGRLGKWDPQTQKITEYPDTWGKHTIRVTPDGMVWSTGGLTRYDPKTETFTHIPEVPNVYGIAVDPDNNIWFAENIKDGKIGKVDAKTLQVTKYYTPTTQRPRRIQVDSDGTVWFAGLDLGMIARFDPAKETFKEFKLPGPRATPYALGIDTEHKIWYSSEAQDVLGRLDPDTGKVTEYPMPFAENGMRDFFLDAQGHVWFGSPPNNKVGYFYLADQPRASPLP